MNKTSYVYKWFNTKTLMWYIGSRTNKNAHPGDGYICSSKIAKPLILENKSDWVREIIAVGTPQEMRLLAYEILDLFDAANDPRSYNQVNLYAPIKRGPKGPRKKDKSNIVKPKVKNKTVNELIHDLVWDPNNIKLCNALYNLPYINDGEWTKDDLIKYIQQYSDLLPNINLNTVKNINVLVTQLCNIKVYESRYKITPKLTIDRPVLLTYKQVSSNDYSKNTFSTYNYSYTTIQYNNLLCKETPVITCLTKKERLEKVQNELIKFFKNKALELAPIGTIITPESAITLMSTLLNHKFSLDNAYAVQRLHNSQFNTGVFSFDTNKFIIKSINSIKTLKSIGWLNLNTLRKKINNVEYRITRVVPFDNTDQYIVSIQK